VSNKTELQICFGKNIHASSSPNQKNQQKTTGKSSVPKFRKAKGLADNPGKLLEADFFAPGDDPT